MKNFVVLDYEGQQIKLCFSTNAMVEFEEQTGDNISVIQERFAAAEKGDFSVKFLRLLFHILLGDHHEDLSLKDAGRIMSAVGLDVAGARMGEAIALAFPEPKPAPAGKRKRAKTAG